jgi:hypothetical protein
MRYRQLRIAWSVVSGVACLLLIVLWARSYVASDIVFVFRPTSTLGVTTCRGVVHVIADRNSAPTPPHVFHAVEAATDLRGPHFPTIAGFHYPTFLDNPESYFALQLPYWFGVLMLVGTAVAPWIPRRFSLRSLLIATTLIAILMGLAVYVASK